LEQYKQEYRIQTPTCAPFRKSKLHLLEQVRIQLGHGPEVCGVLPKTVGMQAEEAQGILKQLKDYGVIDSTDAGLDGYYSLTKLGFALRASLPIGV
jgi:hypothetical protein